MKRMLLAAATLLCLQPHQVFAFTVDGSCTAASPNEDVKVQWTQLPADHKSSANPRSLTPGGDLPGNYQITVTQQSRTLCQGYAEPTSAMRAGMTGVFAAVSPEINLKITLDPSRQGYQTTTGSISCENGTTYAYNLDCGVKVMGMTSDSTQPSSANPEKKVSETGGTTTTSKLTGPSDDSKALSASPKPGSGQASGQIVPKSELADRSPAQEKREKISDIKTLRTYEAFVTYAKKGTEKEVEEYEMAVDRLCKHAGANGGEVKDEMNRLRPRDYYKSHEQTPFVDFTKIVKWRKIEPLEYFYLNFRCGGGYLLLHYLSSIGACYSVFGGLMYFEERVTPEVLKYILTDRGRRDIREDIKFDKMAEQMPWCSMLSQEVDKILGPRKSTAAP